MSDIGLHDEFRKATAGVSVPWLRKNLAEYWERHSAQAGEVAATLIDVWVSADPQQRMGIAMLLGPAADTTPAAMRFLLETVPDDEDWRVQEALAKGFDWFCFVRGFERSVAVIEQWLRHAHPNVRRAAVEGPRVWTKRPYFSNHPGQALDLIGGLAADPSRYVCTSVGNAVSDIGKAHPDLTLERLREWADRPGTAWVIRRACRHLVRTRSEATERLLALLR